MRGGVLWVLVVGAGLLGCFEGGSSSEDQNAAAPARGPVIGAPGRQVVPDVPASLLAELANQPLPSIEEAARITAAYGEVLSSTPEGDELVFGTAALPEEKARIRAALFGMLDSADTEERRDFMRAGLKLLAYFQEGVEGSAPLDAIAPDGRRYRVAVETEVAAVAYELVRRGHGKASN